VDLSKADGVKFMARAEPTGAIRIALNDANRVSYIAKFQATPAWTEVKVPLAALVKNENYQPPEAVLGKPPDWSRVSSLAFDAIQGAGKVWIGPVYEDFGD